MPYVPKQTIRSLDIKCSECGHIQTLRNLKSVPRDQELATEVILKHMRLMGWTGPSGHTLKCPACTKKETT